MLLTEKSIITIIPQGCQNMLSENNNSSTIHTFFTFNNPTHEKKIMIIITHQSPSSLA